MPDWQKLVHEHLAGLTLDDGEWGEVRAELAAHLEESCKALEAEGLPEHEAVRRTLALVPDWLDLHRKVLIAKRGGHLMERRVRQLWIPGFLALILSVAFLMALQKSGFQPRLLRSGPNTILFYVPWLLSLPFFGALAAYVSSRAGGSPRTALLASVFPVLALTGAFLLMFPIGLTAEQLTGRRGDWPAVATALLKDGIGWLLLPGAALLLGALLVLLFLSRWLTSRDALSN